MIWPHQQEILLYNEYKQNLWVFRSWLIDWIRKIQNLFCRIYLKSAQKNLEKNEGLHRQQHDMSTGTSTENDKKKIFSSNNWYLNIKTFIPRFQWTTWYFVIFHAYDKNHEMYEGLMWLFKQIKRVFLGLKCDTGKWKIISMKMGKVVVCKCEMTKKKESEN